MKLEAKSITNQGLPFYSGAIRYKIPLSEKLGERTLISAEKNEGALIKAFADFIGPRKDILDLDKYEEKGLVEIVEPTENQIYWEFDQGPTSKFYGE